MPIVFEQRVHFGPYELDAHAGELYKDGLKLKLQGHPIQILAMLLGRPGELITREEIQQKLWPSESETFVDFEHGLNTAVRKLRQALGDEAETPQYIETLPRRGYRFVGAITSEGIELTEVAEAPVAVAEPRRTETTSNPTKSAVVAIARAPAAPSQEAHQKRLRLRVLLPILIVAVLIAGGALMLRLARS